MWYSGAETLDISPTETFTAAEFNYKQLAGNVTITGLEEIQNSGKEAIHNLLKSRIRNLEKSMKNTHRHGALRRRHGVFVKEVGGLQLLVADIPTNTVGGISGNTYAVVEELRLRLLRQHGDAVEHDDPARHEPRPGSTPCAAPTRPTSSPPTPTTTCSIWSRCRPTSASPTTRAPARLHQPRVQAKVPVIYDDQCPANHMYFLNTDYLFLRPAKGREFVPLGEKSSVNQDALVMPVVWAGNMTMSNRGLQAVICA